MSGKNNFVFWFKWILSPVDLILKILIVIIVALQCILGHIGFP